MRMRRVQSRLITGLRVLDQSFQGLIRSAEVQGNTGLDSRILYFTCSLEYIAAYEEV